MSNGNKRASLDEKKVKEWHEACEKSIQEMKALFDNSLSHAFGEHVAISRMAVHALQGARGLVDNETIALMDSIAAAYDETSGAIAKLTAAHKRMSAESSLLSASLSGVQRKTADIAEHASQLERLNSAMDHMQRHIDSGLFDVAAKVAAAIDSRI